MHLIQELETPTVPVSETDILNEQDREAIGNVSVNGPVEVEAALDSATASFVSINPVVTNGSTMDERLWTENILLPDDVGKVLIIDVMAVVQGLEKAPQVNKMSDLRSIFCKKIQRHTKRFTETRVIFYGFLGFIEKENSCKACYK